MTYQTSERGANKRGPEPNPSKKVVIPRVEIVREQLRESEMVWIAEV